MLSKRVQDGSLGAKDLEGSRAILNSNDQRR